MPIWVLTRENSLVSKESYRKVFDRSEANFDIGTYIGSMSTMKNFYTDFFFPVTVPSPWRYPNKNLLQYDQRPTYMILWKQGNFCKSKLLWVNKFIFEIYFLSSWRSIKNARLQIHTAHGKTRFISFIQFIWICMKTHEFPWLWICKLMNLYEYESRYPWTPMNMNLKSMNFHEFDMKFMSCMNMNSEKIWKIIKIIWTVRLWISWGKEQCLCKKPNL